MSFYSSNGQENLPEWYEGSGIVYGTPEGWRAAANSNSFSWEDKGKSPYSGSPSPIREVQPSPYLGNVSPRAFGSSNGYSEAVSSSPFKLEPIVPSPAGGYPQPMVYSQSPIPPVIPHFVSPSSKGGSPYPGTPSPYSGSPSSVNSSYSGSPSSPRGSPKPAVPRDITTQMIFDKVDASEADIYTQRTYDEIAKNQRKEEEVLVKKGGVCPVEDISRQLSVLNTDILTDYIRTNFDNPHVMKSMKCIMGGVYFHAFDRNGKVKNAAAVSNWFTNTKQIGSPSSNGVAAIVSLRSAKGAAVVKFAKDPKDDDDLVHELFVGMYGANEMRDMLPNFAYVYGGFKCSPGFIDDKGEVVGMCSSDKSDVQYVIYEAISPAKEFFDISTTISAGEYFSTLMQVCLATHIASEMVGWTHYDLHQANVMLREVEKYPGQDFYIRYDMGVQVFYVKARRVATLIDYGMSHIIHNGKSYGHALTRYEVYPNRTSPLFDIYKYLLTTARYLVETPNDAATNVARSFYRYFNTTETLKAAAISQGDVYCVLPYELIEERGLSIPGLLAHVASELPSLFNEYVKIDPAMAPAPLLGCSELACPTDSQIYSDLNVNVGSKPDPRTVMDFYDMVSIMEEDDTMELILGFTQYYNEAMSKHIEQLKDLCRDTNDIMQEVIAQSRKLKSQLFATKTTQDLFSDSTLKEVKEYFTNIAKADFNLKRAEIYFATARHVASMFASEDVIISLDKIKAFIDKAKTVLNTKKASAADLLTYIKSRARTPDASSFFKKNAKLYWYTDNAPYYL